GSRVAESAMGQYSTFQATQPGYYGERGTVVIMQTLLALYPPYVMQRARERFVPLTILTFKLSVPVPELALALIMENGPSTRPEALKIMRKSSPYGSLMFPND
ncbi:hypothetical protein AURDEDRAFT_25289, partial [Auricularia subglabra TFB-10046 SS5]